MYEYQKKGRFFAQTALDIIELVDRELSELGAKEISPTYGGVYFSADKAALYRINYSSSLATRILAPLASFSCRTPEQLYENAKKINWSDFISEEGTFAVFSNVSNSKITNSHFASLRLKDAVVDVFREKTGKRPNIDSRNPDMWLNLHVRNDKAVISLDTSGGSLHRRGYRLDAVKAPMQETVAAAIIRYIEWDGRSPLSDPMCGSGTLLAEALMHYCRIPSGILRKRFGFESMPDFDDSLWMKIKNGIDLQIRELPEGLIAGNDISTQAVGITRKNLQQLQFGDKIVLENKDFRNLKGLENGTIVTNPPYGVRTGKGQELDVLFKGLGDFLKQKCKGSTAYIYFGEREFIKKFGLKPTWKKPLKTGGLDGRLVKYELF